MMPIPQDLEEKLHEGLREAEPRRDQPTPGHHDQHQNTHMIYERRTVHSRSLEIFQSSHAGTSEIFPAGWPYMEG